MTKVNKKCIASCCAYYQSGHCGHFGQIPEEVCFQSALPLLLWAAACKTVDLVKFHGCATVCNINNKV